MNTDKAEKMPNQEKLGGILRRATLEALSDDRANLFGIWLACFLMWLEATFL
jgi:hypothetical protein